MPSEAARNGDYALPIVFLSVQSDESRHIGNGHSMLMSIINNPENHPLLERDIRYAFWQNHAIVDAAIGTFIEYGTKDRNKNRESYAELDRKSTRLNSSHQIISYAVFCLKKKKKKNTRDWIEHTYSKP